jgi:hypothetical protein
MKVQSFNSVGITLQENTGICAIIPLDGGGALYLHGTFESMHKFADLIHSQANYREQEIKKQAAEEAHKAESRDAAAKAVFDNDYSGLDKLKQEGKTLDLSS